MSESAATVYGPATFGDKAKDDSSIKESLDYLSDLADGLTAENSGTFESLDAMQDQEAAEIEGRWFDWPSLRGAQVWIAHAKAFVDRREKLEREHRARKGIPYGTPLAQDVELRILHESMFGTVVKGWRGITKNGAELPFNLANFRDLMRNVSRFRHFVFTKAGEVQAFMDASEDAAGKA